MSRLTALALFGLYDELWSGVAVVAAPAVEGEHALGHAGYALWVFALPMLLSALIEAPLAVWSDRVDRRRLLRLSGCALGAALLLASVAWSPWQLALALALAGAASGAACAAAQAELIAQGPDGSARAMARWSALAAAGDLMVPGLVAALAWLGLGHRVAFALLAALLVIQALRAGRASGQEPADASDAAQDEPLPSLRETLRRAREAPRLWSLLLAASACCLLDEVVVAFAALQITLERGASAGASALGSTLIALGSLLGALLTERLLARASGERLLFGSALLCLLALSGLASSASVGAALSWLFLVGLLAAPHHALLMAAAYEALPRAPGVVNAALQPFVVLEIALPLGAGFVATRYGLLSALLMLAAQPLLVLGVACRGACRQSGT